MLQYFPKGAYAQTPKSGSGQDNTAENPFEIIELKKNPSKK